MSLCRQRTARPVGRQRRKLVWCTFGVQSFAMAATSAKSFNLLGNFEIAGASTLGMTIIRTHARLQIENFAAVRGYG